MKSIPIKIRFSLNESYNVQSSNWVKTLYHKKTNWNPLSYFKGTKAVADPGISELRGANTTQSDILFLPKLRRAGIRARAPSLNLSLVLHGVNLIVSWSKMLHILDISYLNFSLYSSFYNVKSYTNLNLN